MVWKKKLTKKSTSKSTRFRKSNIRRYNSRLEKKHYDFYINFSPTQTGSLYLLSNVSTQGAQDTQRIGDSIYVRNLFFDIMIEQNALSNTDVVRIILFQDKMGVNAPPITDILEPISLSTAFATLAQYNHYFLSRYKLISDRRLHLSNNGNQIVAYKRNYKIMSKLEYVGGATYKNQIYCLIVASNGNVLALPNIHFYSRIMYTDS